MSRFRMYAVVVLVTYLTYADACCQPAKYAVPFDLSAQISDSMQLNISGESYADYERYAFYWGGSGNMKVAQVPFSISVQVKVGVDAEEQVIWYSISSPLVDKCDAYQLIGDLPDNLQCVFSDFRPSTDASTGDKVMITTASSPFYEQVRLSDMCIPETAKFSFGSPVPFAMAVEYGEPVLGDNAGQNMDRHSMPANCNLAGKFKIPSGGPSRTKRMVDMESAVYRRLQRRGIFDFAKKYANRAMDKIKDTVNNPEKIVNKVKNVVSKGKDLAGKMAAKLKDHLDNPDKIVKKVKDVASKGRDVINKVKNALND